MTHLGMGGLNLRQNSLIFISKYRSTSYSSFPTVFPMNPERIRIRIQHPSVADLNFSIPDLNFFHPGSRIGIKEFKYFNPKLCKFLEIWSGLFIQDPDPGSGSWFLPIPGNGMQHCSILSQCGSKWIKIRSSNSLWIVTFFSFSL